MSDYQQKIGPRVAGDTSDIELRGDRTGAQVVTDAHGRYHEAASRGALFSLDSGSVTLAAANTTASAMGTAKFINGFWNPPGSGRNISITRARVALVSGTATGPFVWNFYPASGNVTSVPTGTVRSGLVGSVGGASSVVRPLVGVVLAVLPADTAALVQYGVLGGPAAIAAGAGLYSANEDHAGEIVVAPGVLFGIMQVGASTAVVQSTIIWEETPI